MVVTREVLDQAVRMRRQLNRQVNATTDQLTAAWVSAWRSVSKEWELALTALAEASSDGRWPTRAQVVRADRAIKAIEATQKLLLELSQGASVAISAQLPSLTREAASWQAQMMASQMPPTPAANTAFIPVTFDRVDPNALAAIVDRTTQQITALTWPISAEATAAIQAELIRGVHVGDNPRRAAAQMLKRVNGTFNGGLGRALNIARTEMLDAHRTSAQAQDLATLDVLTGWQWMATLDARTCPSCLVQHGRVHLPEEPGPLDHQQGRCARVPLTKTYEELGIRGVPEPPSALPDAHAWYDQQDVATQTKIMGPGRQQMLASGSVGWDDLSRRRTTTGWRDSYTPTPLKDLEER